MFTAALKHTSLGNVRCDDKNKNKVIMSIVPSSKKPNDTNDGLEIRSCIWTQLSIDIHF